MRAMSSRDGRRFSLASSDLLLARLLLGDSLRLRFPGHGHSLFGSTLLMRHLPLSTRKQSCIGNRGVVLPSPTPEVVKRCFANVV